MGEKITHAQNCWLKANNCKTLFQFCKPRIHIGKNYCLSARKLCLYLLVILEIIRDTRIFSDIAPTAAARASLQGDLKLLKVLINIISFILIITWLRNVGLHRNLEAQKHNVKNISVYIRSVGVSSLNEIMKRDYLCSKANKNLLLLSLIYVFALKESTNSCQIFPDSDVFVEGMNS